MVHRPDLLDGIDDVPLKYAGPRSTIVVAGSVRYPPVSDKTSLQVLDTFSIGKRMQSRMREKDKAKFEPVSLIEQAGSSGLGEV